MHRDWLGQREERHVALPRSIRAPDSRAASGYPSRGRGGPVGGGEAVGPTRIRPAAAIAAGVFLVRSSGPRGARRARPSEHGELPASLRGGLWHRVRALPSPSPQSAGHPLPCSSRLRWSSSSTGVEQFLVASLADPAARGIPPSPLGVEVAEPSTPGLKPSTHLCG